MNNYNPGEYWEDRLKQDFSLLGVGDDSLGKRYNEWLYKVRKRVFPRLIKKHDLNIEKAAVLDIGSGTGFYIDQWKNLHAAHITGADITHTVVETLSKKYTDVEFLQLDIGGDAPTLKGQQFDIISSFDVLYHIVDDERFAKAIHNIYAALKPGGFFVFSDNFLHGETVRGDIQVNRSLQEITTHLDDAGFKVLGRYPMFIIMAYPIDSKSRVFQIAWRVVFRLGTLHEMIGFVFGGLLFPLELALLSIFNESPTTEMMICKKPD